MASAEQVSVGLYKTMEKYKNRTMTKELIAQLKSDVMDFLRSLALRPDYIDDYKENLILLPDRHGKILVLADLRDNDPKELDLVYPGWREFNSRT